MLGALRALVQYYQVNRNGELVRSEDITLPNRSDGFGSNVVMMHDFQITASKVIFMKLPIVVDVAAALQGKQIPFRWDETNGAHLGIMPRTGGSRDVIWIEIDPCFIFHTLNAYDDADGNVVLDASRINPPVWASDNTRFTELGNLCRYTIDLEARTAKAATAR